MQYFCASAMLAIKLLIVFYLRGGTYLYFNVLCCMLVCVAYVGFTRFVILEFKTEKL